MNYSYKILFLLIVFAFITSCSKKASEAVSGTYTGSVTYNASSLGSGTVIITQVGDNRVNINFTIGGDSTVIFNDVAVAGVENPYSLSYSDTSGNLYGQVNNKDLIMTHYDNSSNQTQFSGNK